MRRIPRPATRPPVSLRTQLLLSILLLIALVLGIGSAAVSMHAARKVATEMRAAIAVGVRIANNAVDDVDERSDPSRRLSLLVADFDGDRHVKAIYRDSTGAPVAESRLEPPETSVPEWFHNVFAGRTQTVRVDLPPTFDRHGSLELVTDSHNEVAELWSELSLMLALLSFFCLSTLLMVLALLARAFRPLGALSDAFERIGDGERTRPLDESGPVELARIYRGFNRMRERLGAAESRNNVLAEQLMTVQEEERADIARDLHDEIGPFLFSVDVDVTAIEQSLDAEGRSAIAPRIAMIRDSIRHMRHHVKDILARLRPAALVDVGLACAIDGLVAFWRIRQPSLRISVDVPQDGFGAEIDEAIFRIVQESVSNAVRHGSPTQIAIAARAEAGRDITVSVIDNGRGLDATTSAGHVGFGISGMRDRLGDLGGTLRIAPRPDGPGTRLLANIPLPVDFRPKQHQPLEALAS